MKKVLVIGAGASGLTSLKECLAADLDAVCFEMSNAVGGLWKFTPEETHSSVYRYIRSMGLFCVLTSSPKHKPQVDGDQHVQGDDGLF